MTDFGNIDLGLGGQKIRRDGQGVNQGDGTFKAIHYFDEQFGNYFNRYKQDPQLLPYVFPSEGKPLENIKDKPDLTLPNGNNEKNEKEKLPEGLLPSGKDGTPITDGLKIKLPEDNAPNEAPQTIISSPDKGKKEVQEGPELILPDKNGDEKPVDDGVEIILPEGKDGKKPVDSGDGIPKGILTEDAHKKPAGDRDNAHKADKPKDEPNIDTSKYGNMTPEEEKELIEKAKKEFGEGIAKAFQEARGAKTPTQDTRASNGLNLADANKIYHHMVAKYGTLSKETMSPEDWALLQMANVVFREIGTKANNDGTLPKNYDGWDTSKADELLGEKK